MSAVAVRGDGDSLAWRNKQTVCGAASRPVTRRSQDGIDGSGPASARSPSAPSAGERSECLQVGVAWSTSGPHRRGAERSRADSRGEAAPQLSEAGAGCAMTAQEMACKRSGVQIPSAPLHRRGPRQRGRRRPGLRTGDRVRHGHQFVACPAGSRPDQEWTTGRMLGRRGAVARLHSSALRHLAGISFTGPSQGRHPKSRAAIRCQTSIRQPPGRWP